MGSDLAISILGGRGGVGGKGDIALFISVNYPHALRYCNHYWAIFNPQIPLLLRNNIANNLVGLSQADNGLRSARVESGTRSYIV